MVKVVLVMTALLVCSSAHSGDVDRILSGSRVTDWRTDWRLVNYGRKIFMERCIWVVIPETADARRMLDTNPETRQEIKDFINGVENFPVSGSLLIKPNGFRIERYQMSDGKSGPARLVEHVSVLCAEHVTEFGRRPEIVYLGKKQVGLLLLSMPRITAHKNFPDEFLGLEVARVESEDWVSVGYRMDEGRWEHE